MVEADRNRNTPVDPIAKKALETVEKLQLELHTKDQEAQKERMSRAEVKLMSDIDNTIKTDGYDLIEMLGEQSAVREYMEEVYAQTGTIPEVKDACDAVTTHLVDQYSRVKDSKWLKPKEIIEEKEISNSSTEKPKKTETLTNKMIQSTVGTNKPMNDQERLKAAIIAMEAVKSKR